MSDQTSLITNSGTAINRKVSRWCADCEKDIKLGTGGEGNWKLHIESSYHLLKVKPAESSRLTAYFSKAPRGIKAVPQPKPTLLPPVTTYKPPVELPTPTPKDPDYDDIEFLSDFDGSNHASTSTNGSLQTSISNSSESDNCLSRLRMCISMLPSTTPIANVYNPLAKYVFPRPMADYEDPKIAICNHLSWVFEPDTSISDLMPLVARGPHGLDGFLSYLHNCHLKWNIPPSSFEFAVNKLISAILLSVASSIDPTSKEGFLFNPSSVMRSIHVPSSSTTKPALAPLTLRKCNSLKLSLPHSVTPFSCYPFGAHIKRQIPWTVHLSASEITLQSMECSKEYEPLHSNCSECSKCSSIRKHPIVEGLLWRLDNGTLECTNYEWYNLRDLLELLDRKNGQINGLKLEALNRARELSHCATAIDGHKRLLAAVASSNVKRVNTIVAIGIKRNASVQTMISKIALSAQGLYHPKSYTEAEFDLSYILCQFGGQRSANLYAKVCGGPHSTTTARHRNVPPLLCSHSAPSSTEMAHNLEILYRDASYSSSSQPVRGYSISIDEIALEKRMRWNPRNNMVIGICREHSEECSLEFQTMAEVNMLRDKLVDNVVHIASEATVICVCEFTHNPRQYTAKPFVISGTCKTERAPAQRILLRTAMEAAIPVLEKRNRRLYCFSTDGDSHRRRALAALTLGQELNSSSNIYSRLKSLRLLNKLCGHDDITSDFDWKHVLKRFRNALLRINGSTVNGILLTPAVIQKHLVDSAVLGSDSARNLLNPNDKQDVVLMYSLLNAITKLPGPPEDCQLTYRMTRSVLCLLGKLYLHLLNVYTNTSLSLRDQLMHTSAALHLTCALFRIDSTSFIPSQLMYDLQTMGKATYFNVAKTQVDDPDGSFWIIQQGTDALEKLFGNIRTMVGSDRNTDLYQLGGRLTSAVETEKILSDHPEWNPTPRRLKLPSMSTRTDISQKYDHINVASWQGECHVKDIVLRTPWDVGCQEAVKALKEADIEDPFPNMDPKKGFDLLCPFGGGVIVCIKDGSKDVEEEYTAHIAQGPTSDATTAETSSRTENEPTLNPSAIANSVSESHVDNSADFEPDLEDFAGCELERLANEESTDREKTHHSPWISIDGGDINDAPRNSVKHKATILRYYSDPMSQRQSLDRLKRVRGYTRYNDISSVTTSNADPVFGEACIAVDDPIATLLRCRNTSFLALCQIKDISWNGQRHDSIPYSKTDSTAANQKRSFDNAKFKVQILHFVSRHSSVAETEAVSNEEDWEWSGAYELGSNGPKLIEIAGKFVEPVNPTMGRPSRSSSTIPMTYMFKTTDLLTITHVLYSKAWSKEKTVPLPEVNLTERFPYRSPSGAGCFACAVEGEVLSAKRTARCSYCEDLASDCCEGVKLIEHMAAHILHDKDAEGLVNPCGLCLSTGNICTIHLKKTKGADRGNTIDLSKSRCPNLCAIKLSVAERGSKSSPCTNVPLFCPICPGGSPAIWKYNLENHIRFNHPDEDLFEHADLYAITDLEKDRLLGKFKVKHHKGKRKCTEEEDLFVLSEAHCVRMILRTESLSTGNKSDTEETHNSESEPSPSSRKRRRTDAEPLAELADDNNSIRDPIDSNIFPSPSDIGSHSRIIRQVKNCSGCGNEAGVMDNTVQCARSNCSKLFHLECLHLPSPPRNEWYCSALCSNLVFESDLYIENPIYH